MSLATPEPSYNHHLNQNTQIAEEKFEKFWEIYPKKTGRTAAYEEFVLYGLKWDAIIDGAQRYAESEIADGETRWIKSPVNFIKDLTWQQRFKPGATARRKAQAQRQAQQETEQPTERVVPPRCTHNPSQSVLKCEECKTAWLAQPE